jgi:hypothetical protein
VTVRTPANRECGTEYVGQALAGIYKVSGLGGNMKFAKLLGYVAAAAVGYAVVANMADIRRYIRISTM